MTIVINSIVWWTGDPDFHSIPTVKVMCEQSNEWNNVIVRLCRLWFMAMITDYPIVTVRRRRTSDASLDRQNGSSKYQDNVVLADDDSYQTAPSTAKSSPSSTSAPQGRKGMYTKLSWVFSEIDAQLLSRLRCYAAKFGALLCVALLGSWNWLKIT